MEKKLVLAVASAALLVFCVSCDAVLSEVSVAVRDGDWIEYNVTTTGNPPEEHNVTWARMEILHVNGSEIRINSTSQARNGTVSSLIMTLNVEKGQIGAWWIIPANLDPGAMFYDAFLDVNVTIFGEQKLEYAGAVRDITNTTVPGRVKRWDKATGVFVLSDDELPDYSIKVSAYRTNIWSPQIPGSDSTTYYVTAFVVTLAVVGIVLLIFMRRRKKNGASN